MVRRTAVAGLMMALLLLGSAQVASASTVSATCSTLQTALNSPSAGDVIQLTGLCSGRSFTLTNTNAFTLEGVGNAASRAPS